MEVADEIIQTQVTKFQKITCNGGAIQDFQDSCSLNPKKLATQKGNHHHHHSGFQTQTQIQNQNLNQTQNRNLNFPAVNGGGGRICGWPASRIVRVSRASGGKDRHSKVLTSKGLRDRRIRLSVTTAIDFYDLQDRLGYDQPSKAVEWLIKAAESSISELPSLDPSFSGDYHHHDHHRKTAGNEQSKSCSSTSETSKGSGSGSMISRSENRIRARERAREMAAKRVNTVNGSSFTDLLTGVNGVNSSNQSPEARIHWSSPVDNSFQTMQQFNISGTGENVNQRFSFFQENLTPVSGGGDHNRGESYSLNFQIPPSPASKLALSRGTLQSNVLSSSPHHHHHHFQRSLQFQPSLMADGSVTTNFPFFMAPTIATGAPDHFLATGYVDSQRLQLYGGGDDGIRHSDHHHHHHYKEKSKN